MSSFQQFSRRMRVLSNRFEENTNKNVRRAALAIDQALVLATPVDTGLARSNWLASLSVPRGDTVSPYSPGSKLGLDESANAASAIAQASGVVARRKPEQDIYISNNVPYIGDLNNGTSAQAPKNFVELAVLDGASVIKGAKVFATRI